MKMERTKKCCSEAIATVEWRKSEGVGVLGVGQVTISLRGTSGVGAWGHCHTLCARSTIVSYLEIQ